MRAQGRAAWRRFNVALQSGRPPAREVADGVLVIFGGALLLTPGFLTDIFGLLFLLPPTRAVIRRVFLREAMRRITVSLAGAARMPRSDVRRDDDLEGTATDADPQARSRRVTAAAEEALRDAPTDSVTFAFGDPSAAALRPRPARALALGRRVRARAARWRSCSPAASPSRRSRAARWRSRTDAGWEALELAGVRATIEAPLDRWS